MVNSDPFYHAPRIITPSKIIAIDLHQQGDEKDFTIDEVGGMKVGCDNHGPQSVMPMEAYLVITDAPYFGISEFDGNFEIDERPAGKYLVKLWHEGLGEKTIEINVKEDEDTNISYTYQ